ncbi:hypothetical protein yc1106_00377 [Curvularia clavata]|uniref:Heterokaryon incompatibility domain-containing protein n=1 Tax=Curvularia clavata TaxID=95742 RepID=A0A9Q9DN01_CURCL|nr:hypothetical protein yc1106_00377 [Curvularia clavata]
MIFGRHHRITDSQIASPLQEMDGPVALINTFASAPVDPTGLSSLNTKQLSDSKAISYNGFDIVVSGEPRKRGSIQNFFASQRESQGLCWSCRTLDFPALFDGSIRIFSKKMGWIYKRAGKCEFCGLLLKALSTLYPNVKQISQGHCVITAAPSVGGDSLKRNWLWVRWQSQKLEKKEAVARDAPWGSPVTIDDRVQAVASAIALQAFAPPNSATLVEHSNLLLGRHVYQSVDIQLLRSWLSLCQDCHSQQCEVPQFLGGDFGMRVIDVQRRCVVTATQQCRYVVLSYVWGKARQLLLTAEALSRLVDVDGSLNDHNKSVPMTIRDAMLLCEKMGEKYLWVDALCIQQDSAEDKACQLDMMGSIYQCAAFTIVAACGNDANSGLSGVRPDSRASKQHITQIGSLALGCTLPLFLDSVLGSVWHSRGWTCQEKHLSSRLIIFTSGQVFWRCRTSTFCEDVHLETTMSSTTSRRLEADLIGDFMIARANNPYTRLNRLLVDYTTRQLTYDLDALNAVSGILGKFAPTFTFFWGLPIENIVESLYWYSTSISLKHRRLDFPSWSWVGWKAQIHVNFLPGGGHPIEDRYPPVYPITKVYRLGSRGQCLPLDSDDAIELIKEVDQLAGNTFVYKPFRDWEWGDGNFPDHAYDKPFAWHANNKWPLEPPLLTPEEWDKLRPMRKKILRFHTWTFKIPVIPDQGAVSNELSTYRFRLHCSWRPASIWLDPEWREAQPDKLTFIALAQRRLPDWGATSIDFFLICIEEKDGVAYRVQRVDEQINSDTLFEECEPKWRAVNLA